MRILFAAGLTAALAASLGCSDPNEVVATIPNAIDTVTIAALQGTPLALPSAYSVADARTVRTDQSSFFDFAYNVDGAGRPVFLTQAVLGLGDTLGTGPGFQKRDQTFDEVTRARSNGYRTTDTVAVAVGDVYMARSRIVCGGLGLPLYGKIEILALDAPSRTVTFQILTNLNCGFRDLLPGIPEN